MKICPEVKLLAVAVVGALCLVGIFGLPTLDKVKVDIGDGKPSQGYQSSDYDVDDTSKSYEIVVVAPNILRVRYVADFVPPDPGWVFAVALRNITQKTTVREVVPIVSGPASQSMIGWRTNELILIVDPPQKKN